MGIHPNTKGRRGRTVLVWVMIGTVRRRRVVVYHQWIVVDHLIGCSRTTAVVGDSLAMLVIRHRLRW